MRAAAILLGCAALGGCFASIDDSKADKRNATGGTAETPSAPPPGSDLSSPPGTSNGGGSPGSSGTTNALPEGLIGYWSFDDISGATVKDASGKNHDGTTLTSPSLVNGVVGKALDFPNAQQFWVSALDGASFPSEGTLSLHVNVRQTYGSLLDDPSDTTRAHLAIRATGTEARFLGPSANVGLTTSSPGTGWHWIVITWGGGRGQLYIDGFKTNDSAIGSFAPNGQQVLFGVGIDGSLDEIALYDKVVAPPALRRTL